MHINFNGDNVGGGDGGGGGGGGGQQVGVVSLVTTILSTRVNR